MPRATCDVRMCDVLRAASAAIRSLAPIAGPPDSVQVRPHEIQRGRFDVFGAISQSVVLVLVDELPSAAFREMILEFGDRPQCILEEQNN